MSKPIYSDRDYLEARFSALDEKFDMMISLQEKNGERIGKVEDELGGAKLLGRVALGVTAAMGAFVTWAVDIYAKLPHFKV
jgi:hypothetical protein